MKIALFSFHVSNFGGGAEAYALRLAQELSKRHEVTVFTTRPKNGKAFDPSVFAFYGTNPIHVRLLKYRFAKKRLTRFLCDLLLWIRLALSVAGRYGLYISCSSVTFCGLPFVKSVQVVHFPERLTRIRPLERLCCLLMRLTYDRFLPNSGFTQGWLQRRWGVTESQVIYPPILTEDLLPAEKEPVILCVGRMDPDKQHENAIRFFCELESRCSYKLVIAGNKSMEAEPYYEQLCRLAEGHRIELHCNCSYEEMISYYCRADIFWHSKGYQVPDDMPMFMEHFGMSTVEAMAAGCIPLVVGKGGQREIVDESVNGFFWSSGEELIEKTLRVIRMSPEEKNRLRQNAVEKSRQFSPERFSRAVRELIG